MKKSKENYDFLFCVENNNILPAKGRVLISEPLLEGRHFARSVVLLTEHNEQGSMGFVLNNPLLLNLNDMIDLFPQCKSPVFLGGPVHTDHLFYIHTLGAYIPDSYPLGANLFWGGDLNVVKELIEKQLATSDQIRFFTGYAGWSPGQLEAEIEEKSWIVSLLSTAMIMDEDTDNLWGNAIAELGKKYRHWLYFPRNPIYN